MTASHQRVDVALSLCLVEAVLGHDLGHDIILVLERGSENLFHFAPISLRTICLVSVEVPAFTAGVEATLVMKSLQN